MAIVDLNALPPNGAILGLDPGSKTIGVAASDPLRMIATPVHTIRRTKLAADLIELFDLFDARHATCLVVGLPLNMDGARGPRAQSSEAFGRNVLAYRDIPITFIDERLSTAQARRAMLEADLSRARRAELIDKSAAAIILQSALDQLAGSA